MKKQIKNARTSEVGCNSRSRPNLLGFIEPTCLYGLGAPLTRDLIRSISASRPDRAA